MKENGINSIDASGGIVKVARYCTTSEDYEDVRASLEEAFLNSYKEIAISALILSPVNSLPIDFDEFRFESLKLNSSILRSNRGSVGAVYINGSGVRKTINFRFAISATISGYKARHNL